MSARNRRVGHGWEVRCANELSAHLGLDIVTSRSLGANYGADLATVQAYDAHGRPVLHAPSVLGWSIECKRVGNRVPKAWLRQARGQRAPGLTPAVLWTPWTPSAKRAWSGASVFLEDVGAARGWVELPIHEWLSQAWARPRREYADEVADRVMADRLADGHY